MAKREKKVAEYYGGKIKALVDRVAQMVSANPRYGMDSEYLHTMLARDIAGYGKRDACFNCGRSMMISVYTADVLDGVLLVEMARDVADSMRKGMTFTEANQVYLPGLATTQGVLKRQTKCDYLGFIKQPEGLSGTGRWVITSWGWSALRGGSVPKAAHYWEGKLIRRSEETTTLTEMFATHREMVADAIARTKTPRSDYRSYISDYNPADWSEYDGSVNGMLI